MPVPVDWAHPNGPKLDWPWLAARPPASAPPSARWCSARVGRVTRVLQVVVGNIGRFSPEVRRRFDIISFDPPGVGAGNPVSCSVALLAERPSRVLRRQEDFDATLAYNKRLEPTAEPVQARCSTTSTPPRRSVTFHGCSYGTLLGTDLLGIRHAEVFIGVFTGAVTFTGSAVASAVGAHADCVVHD